MPADSSTPYVSGNDYSAPGIGFGHVGFTVPDVAETLERVRSFGFEVIKPLDKAKTEQMGMPADIVQGQHGEVAEGYKNVFKQLAFVKDPDVSSHATQESLPHADLDRAIGLSLYLKWLNRERSWKIRKGSSGIVQSR